MSQKITKKEINNLSRKKKNETIIAEETIDVQPEGEATVESTSPVNTEKLQPLRNPPPLLFLL